MDTLDTLVVGAGGGYHWTVIAMWVVLAAVAIGGVALLIRYRSKAADRKREYLQEHPQTDPHRPRKP